MSTLAAIPENGTGTVNGGADEAPFVPMLPYYETIEHTAPSRYVSFDDLAAMCAAPSVKRKTLAPALTPFYAASKKKAATESAQYHAIVQDHDDDDLIKDEIRVRYKHFHAAYLAFTSASHQQEKGGITARRWKVVIPLAEPVCLERYTALAVGMTLLNNTDAAQARAQQVFFAPNKISDDAPFEYINALDNGFLNGNDDNHFLVKACLEKFTEYQQAQEAQARAAKVKPRSIAHIPDGEGIIGKIVSQFSLSDELQSHGYRKIGKTYLSPASSTGTPGVIILERDAKEVCYSHHGATDKLSNLNNDGHSLDVVDILAALEFGGDMAACIAHYAPLVDPDGQRQRQREYMAQQARQERQNPTGSFDQNSTQGPSKAATHLADEITTHLLDRLEYESDKEAEIKATIAADAAVIDTMINGSFWSGSKSKLFMLNHDQSLVQFLAKDAYKFLTRTYGKVIDSKAVEAIAANMSFGGEEGSNAEDERRRKFVGSCMAMAQDIVLDYLKYENQRDSVEWRVDMFATHPRLELLEDKARIVLTHKPYEVAGTYEPEIVNDYKEHFPRFDEFLKFLVMSRFALDRKKAYLWFLASSDWGKGFLVNGVLGRLNTTVETSVREIEAMFEGKPVGRGPEEFKRALALVVDEFKVVKSEIKQLQSEITLSPKHQLTCSVEIFAKIFMSAESVASLVTENGVEDQFANRMSIFQEKGSLVDRSLYEDVGNPRYLASILNYTANFLNVEINAMQAKGRMAAQTEAEKWLSGFIGRNGLDTLFERFSDTLPDVAQEAVNWLHTNHMRLGEKMLRDGSNGAYYLKTANVVLDEFLEEHFDRTEIGAYRKRKKEILESMSADGKGTYPHRVNNMQVKSVMLKPSIRT